MSTFMPSKPSELAKSISLQNVRCFQRSLCSSPPFPPLLFSCGDSTVTSATSYHWAWICRPVVASSGVGARRVKIRGQPPPGMTRRHPSSSCGVGARAGGPPRDAPPHPFKEKLGDHFSAAPEITPGWGLAPGCGTHGSPHRCRSELVGLQRQFTISATIQISAANPPGYRTRRADSPAKPENTKLKDRQITMQSLISPATSFV